MRIATLNLLNHEESWWDDRERMIATEAAELAPDIHCFQEVDRLDVIADALQPAEVVEYRNPDPDSIKSLAVVTRRPVEAVHRAEIGHGDIALHVRVDGVDIVTTHLLFKPDKEGSAIRAEQAARLLAWMDDLGVGPPTVFAGDCNAREGGAALTMLFERFRPAGRVACTFPTPLIDRLGYPPPPPAQIDWILVAGLEVDHFAVAYDRSENGLHPSDHLGLLADVRPA